jgi:transcription antitermination factor NusG
MEETSNWYVVYTRPRWEKKVAKLLLDKGIRHYCPLNRVMKQWSDRRKIVHEPLFKGYVFVNTLEKDKWEVKKIDGVLNYVYWLGKPARIQETEINTIKMFLQEFTDVEVINRQLDINDKVIIKQGVLMNYRGIIVEVSGNKARVRIDSMGIQLSAIFDKVNLEPLVEKR